MIRVPPVDPGKVAAELARRAASLEEELRRLEEAKRVSRETMELAAYTPPRRSHVSRPPEGPS